MGDDNELIAVLDELEASGADFGLKRLASDLVRNPHSVAAEEAAHASGTRQR